MRLAMPSGIGFEADIKPLFRLKDISSMKKANLDLSSYADVSSRADEILQRLQDGNMPCDGAWPQSQVATFKQWVDGGKLP